MAKDTNFFIGKNLEIARKKLLFSRKTAADKAGITARSLELIEKSDKYMNLEDRNKYIAFLGLTLDILTDRNFNLTWQELTFILKKNHPSDAKTAEIEVGKVIPKQVITQRALPGKLLEKPISVADLKEAMEIKYQCNFDRNKIQNALNNLVMDGVLVKSQDSPIKYQRCTKKFPSEIDLIFDLVVRLEEIYNIHTANLVNYNFNKANPSFRKMAKILLVLKDCQRSRSDLFLNIGMANDSNNVIRTIAILERLVLIQKTELAPKSSKQKYKLTKTGVELVGKFVESSEG